MKTEKTTFTWYATHPQHGELVLAIPSINSYRNAYIYCPRIIRERLRPKINLLLSLELSLGPVGFIPRCYYEEAGIMVRTPMSIRLLAVTDEHRDMLGLPDEHVGHHDDLLSNFILDEWKKFTNPVDAA